MDKILFSSARADWETPQDLYDKLNAEFHFTCDVAADYQNHKHENYYTAEMDGIIQPWEGVCWCNPPYGRNVGRWVEKAYCEAQRGVKTVMLLPARTDTRWFHEWIYRQQGVDTRFLKGRLKFGGCSNSAPFPSMIVVFGGNGEIENPKWISITDRQPAHEERVLAYQPNNTQADIGPMSVLWGWACEPRPRRKDISHWMPLPDPPGDTQL